MTLQELFIANLKGYRKQRKLSQWELAEECKSFQTYIAELEVGKKSPSFEMVERIAAALKIDAPALFSTKSYASPDTGTMTEFQEQVIHDLTQILTYRIGQLTKETPG